MKEDPTKLQACDLGIASRWEDILLAYLRSLPKCNLLAQTFIKRTNCFLDHSRWMNIKLRDQRAKLFV
ncbi:hypothetical protein A11M_0101065 [Xanthomonas vasicola pv. vasculorum NCPPB 895]|nr:hypothetical protein A11M_0101065 [Xanthomonas vasicola pv. vasculorum NCPPB 895]